MSATPAYLVDRLTDDLHRQVPGLAASTARVIADRCVGAYLTRDEGSMEELSRARAALHEIRLLLNESARAGSSTVPVQRGKIVAILDRWGVR